MGSYDTDYYDANDQNGDRIALKWYAGLAARRIAKGGRVLDYGCGTGYFLRRLDRFFDVSGFDISDFARTSASQLVPSATMYPVSTAVPDSSHDGVVSLHVLEHIEQPLDAFREMHRILKPGGTAMVVVPDCDGRGHRKKGKDWFAYKDPTHCTFLTSAEWCVLAIEAGFEVVLEGSDGLWDSPYSGLPRIIDRLVYGAPLILRVLTTTLDPRPNRGECAVLILRKPTGTSTGANVSVND